jgi:hypothetical protein
LPGGAEGNHEQPQRGYPMPRLRFQQGTSRI